jgi:CHASE2 domain-containing sensor protein
MQNSASSPIATPLPPSPARPSWRKRFLPTLIIAVALDATANLVHPLYLFGSFENVAMDQVIKLYRNVPSSGTSPLLAFVDIDEGTYRDWGFPLFIPRDKLAHVIVRVASVKPALIVVDVPLATSAPEASEDAPLLRLLANYVHLGAPPLILAAPLAYVPHGRDTILASRSSFIDSLVRRSDRIAFASSVFTADPDNVVRRWNLWQPLLVDTPPETPHLSVMPSLQLLTLGHLHDPRSSPRQLQSDLERELAVSLQSSISHQQFSHIHFGGETFSVPQSKPGQRIFFRYPDLSALAPGERYPPDPRTGQPLLRVLPASSFAGDRPINPSSLAGRVVVIGASFRDGKDIYHTPLGLMPGAMIIVNSIDSLLRHGEIKELPPLWDYLIFAFLVACFALLFARLRMWLATLCSFAIILVLIVPLSVHYLPEGYWLDFSIPLVAVYAHKLLGKPFAALERLAHRLLAHQTEATSPPPATLLLVAFLTLPAPQLCDVLDVSGPASLLHASHLTPLQTFDSLYDGDIVSAPGERSKVTLQCGSARYVIRMNNSPFPVHGKVALPTPWHNLLHNLADVYRNFTQARDERQILGVRSGEAGMLRSPLLYTTPAHVAAAHHSLCLAWFGGSSPFTLRLYLKGSTHPLRIETAGRSQHCLRFSMGLRPRVYELAIQDATGHEVSYPFEAVAAGTLPSSPEEFRHSNLDPSLLVVLESARLAAAANGAYRFESYQRLVHLKNQLSSARLLGDLLEEGYPLDLKDP